MNRQGISMSIETLGKLVLIILIAVAIIVFVITAINVQTGAFNQTGSGIIGNLTDSAQSGSGVTIT